MLISNKLHSFRNFLMQSNMLFTVWEMDRITYDMDDFAVGRLGVDRRRCGMPEVWWLILTNRGRWIVERSS